jgi:hypothetical protein
VNCGVHTKDAGHHRGRGPDRPRREPAPRQGQPPGGPASSRPRKGAPFPRQPAHDGRAPFSASLRIVAYFAVNWIGLFRSRGKRCFKCLADRAETPRPVTRGANFAAYNRADPKKSRNSGSLRDHREPRLEFSHGLLDFCTNGNVCKQVALARSPCRRRTPAPWRIPAEDRSRGGSDSSQIKCLRGQRSMRCQLQAKLNTIDCYVSK